MAQEVTPLPTDRPIDQDVLKEHKVSRDEYERILSVLGREPTFTELGVFSVMWSEHCSYKSSRVHLKRLPSKGPRVVQGPGENAGVVDIGDGFCAVFKMESHNHPSFIEPYQGAATGVGGILRDVFTMGARPIAALDSLRFGRPDHPRTHELLRGVVAGIGGYGNCFGVPTVGGETQFDSRYDENILVNAFTCGVAKKDRIFYGRATGVGNPILYIGAKTGRDGIHGATMASDEFGDESPDAEVGTAASIRSGVRSTMQVGDPFLGKVLLEACLELFSTDLLEGIQDMGAAGLTSSSVEMAGRAGSGVEIDLDRVPRRAHHMLPYELLLSESQERMLLVARRGVEDDVLAICRKWDIDAAVIGEVTDSGRWVVKATPGFDPLARTPNAPAPVVVCDIPIAALTDDAPKYDRPRALHLPGDAYAELDDTSVASDARLADTWLSLLASPNVTSKSWIFRQYDHIVRGGTQLGPGSDAAVVRVPCESGGRRIDKFLAFAVDGNGRMCELDPKTGGAMAVSEACRNVVCSGGRPIGLTDCLNFGNPERPDVMEQFSRAIDGIRDACLALDVPIVSGNVSLYNETAGRAIFPTPTIAAVGLVRDPQHVTTQAFQRAGDRVILLGEALCPIAWLAASEYLTMVDRDKALGAKLPAFDLEAEARLQKALLEAIESGWISSAHDLADGGLAVALAESATTGGDPSRDIGARIDLPDPGSKAARIAALFGEMPSRVLLSVPGEHAAKVMELMRKEGVPAREIGTTGGDTLSIAFGAPLTDTAEGVGSIGSAPIEPKTATLEDDGLYVRVAVRDVRKARTLSLRDVAGDATLTH